MGRSRGLKPTVSAVRRACVGIDHDHDHDYDHDHDHDHGATRPCWSEKEKSNAVTDIEIAEKSSSGREPRPGKG